MGQIKYSKLIVLVVLLLLTGALIHIPRDDVSGSVTNREENLNQLATHVPGWQFHQFYRLDQNIVDELKLDEYVNHSYTRDGQELRLYVGYYQTAQKVGAAHDPLVCFPGQGWTVSGTRQGTIELASPEKETIHYSEMVVEQGEYKQLVLYWFQAHDSTSASTMSQKLTLLKMKLLNQGQDNAFVRFSTQIGKDETVEDARRCIIKFVESFYPMFLKYINA